MSDKNPDKNLVLRGGTYWIKATIKSNLIQRSLRTRDIKVARQERDRLIKEAEDWAWRGNRVVTWADAVKEWMESAKKDINAKTMLRYLVSLKQVAPYFDTLNIAAIKNKNLGDYARMRRNAGVSNATIRRDLTAISHVMNYAILEDWREDNPSLSRRRLIKEKHDPITLPEIDDVETMISASSPGFGALIRAAWLTGCRQDELVNAKWRGYDGVRKTLRVIGKGNKQRVISLNPCAGKDATDFFKNLPRKNGVDLIFFKTDGTPFSQAASDFTHIRRAVIAKAHKEGRGFHRFRFHDLRHLFAVEALKGGMSIYDLQQHLGHTSVKTTEIYLEHLTVEEKAHAKGGSAYTQFRVQSA